VKIGTRSVLFGAHAFWLHPFILAEAWRRLFGFPWDPRLWVLFFVHDLGYLGKPNMDGPEGETHVELGARIMTALFDGTRYVLRVEDRPPRFLILGDFGLLSLLHSRFYAKRLGMRPSKLCLADKLAICLTPAWLYLPMTRLTGELSEYMSRSEQKEGQKYATMVIYSSDERQWYENMRGYVGRWVEAHKDGREDTWTPAQEPGQRQPADGSGTWR
jgi:hypothetical protein